MGTACPCQRRCGLLSSIYSRLFIACLQAIHLPGLASSLLLSEHPLSLKAKPFASSFPSTALRFGQIYLFFLGGRGEIKKPLNVLAYIHNGREDWKQSATNKQLQGHPILSDRNLKKQKIYIFIVFNTSPHCSRSPRIFSSFQPSP